MNKIETGAAKVISYIFHPLLLPTYAIIIIFNLNYFFSFLIPFNTKLLLLANVFGFTFLLPVGMIYMLIRLSFVKSYQMHLKNERAIPLLITGTFYYLMYYLFRQIGLPALLSSFFLGATIVLLVTIIINLSWKISLHSIAIGALTGMMISIFLRLNIDTLMWIIILIICSGLIGFARLKLNAHSPAQVYVGYFTGFAIMFGFYYLL